MEFSTSNMNGGDPIKKLSPTLALGIKEVNNKFSHLQRLVEQLNVEELKIRQLMQKNCQDLKKEVEQMETKQQRLGETLRKAKNCL